VSTINVEVREQSGKGVARKLRAVGRIPAVLYGQGQDPVALALEPRGLEKLLHSEGHNALFDLDGDETVKGRTVLVKALQRHPVRGELMHADFFEIDARKTITVSVGIHLVGTPVGVSLDGGLVDHSLREIELDCLPRSIPESIDVDITELHLGDTLHVSDLPLPEGVEIRTAGELGVVSVVAPRVEEVEEGVEAAEVEGEAAAPEAEEAAGDEGSPEA
jgi:large subunit ribosomal protein L25